MTPTEFFFASRGKRAEQSVEHHIGEPSHSREVRTARVPMTHLGLGVG